MTLERFTPRAKKTVELALREALALGHNYIGTEHLLLGILRDNEGVAALILRDRISHDEARNAVVRIANSAGVGDVYAQLRDLQAEYAKLRESAPYLPPDPFADALKDRVR